MLTSGSLHTRTDDGNGDPTVHRLISMQVQWQQGAANAMQSAVWRQAHTKYTMDRSCI